MEDEEAYQRSLELEPRTASGSPTRGVVRGKEKSAV